MSYFVYIVTCEDGSLYTGIASDIVRRLGEHLSQRGPCAKYTRAHRVTGLAGLWRAPDRASASKLEYRIKQLAREEKDALVDRPSGADALVSDTPPRTFRSVSAAQRQTFWERAQTS